MLPNLLGIGAARSGTTSLHALLSKHPDVFMAAAKELHFFTYLHPEVGGARLFTGETRVMTQTRYEAHFAEASDVRWRGEISPSYLWIPDAAPRIKALIPDARIIILLRDPVERALSEYRWSQRNPRAWRQSYPHAVASIEEFIDQGVAGLLRSEIPTVPFAPATTLWKGFYARQIKAFCDLFDRENLFIDLFERMIGDPARFQGNLFGFLDIPDLRSVELPRTHMSEDDTVMPERSREALRKLYREDVAALAELIGEDLGHWLT